MILKRLKNTYFITGIIFLGALLLVAILRNLGLLSLSMGSESLVSAVFGWGGIILIVIGILKAIFSRGE